MRKKRLMTAGKMEWKPSLLSVESKSRVKFLSKSRGCPPERGFRGSEKRSWLQGAHSRLSGPLGKHELIHAGEVLFRAFADDLKNWRIAGAPTEHARRQSTHAPRRPSSHARSRTSHSVRSADPVLSRREPTSEAGPRPNSRLCRTRFCTGSHHAGAWPDGARDRPVHRARARGRQGDPTRNRSADHSGTFAFRPNRPRGRALYPPRCRLNRFRQSPSPRVSDAVSDATATRSKPTTYTPTSPHRAARAHVADPLSFSYRANPRETLDNHSDARRCRTRAAPKP